MERQLVLTSMRMAFIMRNMACAIPREGGVASERGGGAVPGGALATCRP